MAKTTTLADLKGENALVIVGAIGGLLKRLDREVGTKTADEYRAKALSGDYAHVCEVSEEYALRYLATTLSAREGDLTDNDNDDEYEED